MTTSSLRITTDQNLPSGVCGTPYSVTLKATGGTPPLAWYIPPEQLPSGLGLDTVSGEISGTVLAKGAQTAEVTVHDSSDSQQTAHSYLNFTFVNQEMIVTTTALPNATVGQSYSATLSVEGGAGPYIWSVNPDLPAGLLLDPGWGLISGAPEVAGSALFEFAVTDSTAATASGKLKLDVTSSSFHISTTSLPNATVGQTYEANLSATDGVEPYLWSVESALPDGLTLEPTSGRLSGTPQVAASSEVTFDATDKTSAKVSRAIELVVTSSVSSPAELEATLARVIWYCDDIHSGAHKDVSFGIPDMNNVPVGWYYVGQVAVPSHQGFSLYFSLVVKDGGSSQSKPAVKPPDTVVRHWEKTGYGGMCVVSFVCNDPDYVALGDFYVRNYANDVKLSDFPRLGCIRKDLLVDASYQQSDVWDDHGSGARDDVSLWSLNDPRLMWSDKNGQSGFLFKAVPSYPDSGSAAAQIVKPYTLTSDVKKVQINVGTDGSGVPVPQF